MAEARFDGDGAKTIDQLVKEEKLSQQSGANLKAAYDTLLETLKESQDRERQDLLRVKELSDRLKGGNDAGPAREGGADGAGSAEAQDDNNLAALDSEGPSNNRIAELRRDLADRSAQVAVKQHELSSLEEQLERLKIESEELEHEASGEALNEAETDGEELVHIRAAISRYEEEVAERKLEVTTLSVEAAKRKDAVETAQLAQVEIENELAETRIKLQVASTAPQRVAKQAEHQFAHAIKSLKGQLAEANALNQTLMADLAQHDDQRATLAQQSSELALHRERKAHSKDMVKRRLELDSMELMMKKEEKKGVLADNARTTEMLKLELKEIARTEDIIARKVREKDAGLRNLRLIELKVNNIQQQGEEESAKCDGVNSFLRSKKLESADVKQAIEQAVHDTEGITRKMEGRIHLSQEVKITVRDLKEKVAKVTEEAAKWQRHNHGLSRDLRGKTHMVDQAVAESMRATARAERAQAELGGKELVVNDSTKSIEAIFKTLKDLEVVYQIVKNEKNKFVTQISNSHQRQTEMKDKVRIYTNETEIMRLRVLEKDANVQLKAQRLNGEHRHKEKLLNKVTHVKLKRDDIIQLKKSIKVSIVKQDETIAAQQARKVQLDTRFEKAVQEKNELGKQVIERHDELGMYYEKLAIYSRMIRSGDLKTQERDEEIRFLKLQVQELGRGINLARSLQPNKKALENELIDNRLQLLETQQKVQELEKLLESPTSSRKWRFLEGPEATRLELEEKSEGLANRLHKKEEIGVERDLLLAETQRLTERAQDQLAAGRGDTLTLARTMNDYQAKIKDVTRKLMASLSEVTMYHGTCIQREQQSLRLEQTLADAEERLQRGLPPTQDAAEEWMRLQTRLEQQYAESEMAALGITATPTDFGDEDLRALPDGTQTFAELRPNAYIPDGLNDLPVPRPYGRDAPFKPSEASAHLRHFRRAVKTVT